MRSTVLQYIPYWNKVPVQALGHLWRGSPKPTLFIMECCSAEIQTSKYDTCSQIWRIEDQKKWIDLFSTMDGASAALAVADSNNGTGATASNEELTRRSSRKVNVSNIRLQLTNFVPILHDILYNCMPGLSAYSSCLLCACHSYHRNQSAPIICYDSRICFGRQMIATWRIRRKQEWEPEKDVKWMKLFQSANAWSWEK